MNLKVKDPVSGYSHLAGAIIFFFGSFFLIKNSGNPLEFFSFFIFGASACLLYAASAWYHLFGAPREKISYARKLDHAFIYLLIAGTFTPFCLLLIQGLWGGIVFAAIWIIAIIGISAAFLDSFWRLFPRKASTGLYLLMGWIGAALIYPLRAYPTIIAFIAAGGLFYTIGGIIYAFKKPNLNKYFGFHELFHFFILAGTAVHFWCIYKYLS